MADTFRAGKLLREGLKVALVGRPNVGKSSLFNSLLGQERAIVTDIAGTTRDQLFEKIVINNIPVSLIDTAGLRETTDTVEIIGVERSRRIMADADLVVLLLDGSQKLTAEDTDLLNQIADYPALIVFNKSDLGIYADNGLQSIESAPDFIAIPKIVCFRQNRRRLTGIAKSHCRAVFAAGNRTIRLPRLRCQTLRFIITRENGD
jgi:tRNA modification GTPase